MSKMHKVTWPAKVSADAFWRSGTRLLSRVVVTTVPGRIGTEGLGGSQL